MATKNEPNGIPRGAGPWLSPYLLRVLVLGLPGWSGLRRGQGLDDLDPHGGDGIIQGSYHRDVLVDCWQGLVRRRLDQEKAVLAGEEVMLFALFHHMAASDDLNDRENGVGGLRGIAQHFRLKVIVRLEDNENNVVAHVNDDVGNAILAFESRFDLGSAGPSERTGGTRRRFFDLSTGRNTGANHQNDCQNQPRVNSHANSPFARTKTKGLWQL